MVAWRTLPSLAGVAPYALAAAFFALGSTRAGYQELLSLVEPAPAAAERWNGGALAAALGTGRLADLGLPRPLGTRIPTTATPSGPTSVNRSSKGDFAMPGAHRAVVDAIAREHLAAGAAPAGIVGSGATPDRDSSLPALPAYDVAMSLEADPQLPATAEAEEEIAKAAAEAGAEPPDEEEGAFGTASLYFGSAHMNAVPRVIEPWAPGEAPVIVAGPAARPVLAAVIHSDVTAEAEEGPGRAAALSVPHPPVRGRVVPSDLLELEGKARARAERCLANAVYFEARSEPVRGQIAVAQVVLNRALSGYYPEDICGVVYQGANRHLSCQFTFACDGIPDVVTEPEPWRRAQRIAKAALDGKIWLHDVGKATHYHASYVNPYWVRSMRRLRRIGLHTFYRPRRWGDGAEAPSWGSPANTEIAANL